MDDLEEYIKERKGRDKDVHDKEETDWFDKMHPQCEALDTFYPEEKNDDDDDDEEEEEAAAPAPAPKRRRRGEK